MRAQNNSEGNQVFTTFNEYSLVKITTGQYLVPSVQNLFNPRLDRLHDVLEEFLLDLGSVVKDLVPDVNRVSDGRQVQELGVVLKLLRFLKLQEVEVVVRPGHVVEVGRPVEVPVQQSVEDLLDNRHYSGTFQRWSFHQEQ